VFGGITGNTWSGDTWIWNGDDWSQANSPTNPPAREKLAMAYDETRDRVVLFGGAMDQTAFDDTWEWDGNSWQMMRPAHSPPARCCHAMAYDQANNRVFMYGGWNHFTGEFFGDAWEWDGTDWVEVTCCNAPPASAHVLLNYAARSEIIALNSQDFGNWVWDGASWQNTAIDQPPARQDGRLAYDDANARAILFGGIHDGVFLNDIWVFDGQTWQSLNLSTTPPPRYGHLLFYDAKRQSMILFSGAGDGGALVDTWELYLPADLSALLLDATPAR
jgi:hypothetical protein